MEKTNQAFRLIVVRRLYQPRLFGEEEIDLKERYKVIATNLDWPKDVVVKWYDARGEYSENRIKELKIGFSMERMPSSYFKANAVFFRIGCLAYNLFRIFQLNGSLYFSLLISTYFLVKNTLFQKSIADFGYYFYLYILNCL